MHQVYKEEKGTVYSHNTIFHYAQCLDFNRAIKKSKVLGIRYKCLLVIPLGSVQKVKCCLKKKFVSEGGRGISI